VTKDHNPLVEKRLREGSKTNREMPSFVGPRPQADRAEASAEGAFALSFRPPRIQAGSAVREARQHMESFAQDPRIWATRPKGLLLDPAAAWEGGEESDLDPEEAEAAELEEKARELIALAMQARQASAAHKQENKAAQAAAVKRATATSARSSRSALSRQAAIDRVMQPNKLHVAPPVVIDAGTDPRQLAKDVMQKADWFHRNGSITESELRTSLERSPYRGFCNWLNEGRPSLPFNGVLRPF